MGFLMPLAAGLRIWGLEVRILSAARQSSKSVFLPYPWSVIVAPFRSLCHDIRGDLARAFAGENVALDEATDSYQFDLALDELLAKRRC